jgi:GT2 family glycosyltransferase
MKECEQGEPINRVRDADKSPSVGAVVVNFNGGDRVLRVMEALHCQSYPLARIVVIDNCSTDDSIARIRRLYPAVQAVELTGNLGLSAARNIGLRALRTDLAFLVDHDIYAEKSAIELMVAVWLQHKPSVICPRIRLLPERDTVQMEGAAIHFLSMLVLCNSDRPITELADEGGYVDAFTGGCLLFHRQAILDAGAFDEMFFFYFEDLELALRLRLKGHRFWCEPRAEVFHEPAAGTPGLSYRRGGAYPRRRANLTMRNRILVILMHYRVRTIIVLSPVLALFELASLLMACFKGWPGEWFRAWGWQLINRRQIRARRRSSHLGRECRDRDILIGGPLPVAAGFVRGRLQKHLFAAFSLLVNGYWLLSRRWIG